jgi:branched-chain amino acid transport system substrate-binding protein
MKLRKVLILVLLLTLALTSLNVNAQDEMAEPPDFAVKIAVMAPLTGDAAFIGVEQLNWATLAIEDFNEAYGWNVELVEADTQLDAALAVTVGESLIADADVYGVVGPAGSQEVSAIQEAFEAASLAHVSGSATNPALTQDEETDTTTFFRTVPTDDVQGPTDATFAFEVLGATSAFVIDDQSSYAVELADQFSATFEELGGEIADRQSVTQDDTDFSALVTSIGESGADIVFFPGQIATQGALLAQQGLEQGLDLDFLGADGFQNVEAFITGSGGATEGAYVSSFAPDVRGVEAAADAVAEYVEAYDDQFTSFGPPSYVAAQVVLEAMRSAWEANGELTREGVAAAVAETNLEMTILGIPLSFDEKGDVEGASFYIFVVEGDSFVLVTGEE